MKVFLILGWKVVCSILLLYFFKITFYENCTLFLENYMNLAAIAICIHFVSGKIGFGLGF